jgi:hypothetical protein
MEGNDLVSFQCKSQDPHSLVFKFKPVVPWIESKWVSALEDFRWNNIRRKDGRAFSDLSGSVASVDCRGVLGDSARSLAEEGIVCSTDDVHLVSRNQKPDRPDECFRKPAG